MKRKGFGIVEILTICAMLTVLLFLLVKPTRALFVDMNHTHKDFNENSTVYDLLTKLRKDIEIADYVMQDPVDPNALLLEDSGVQIRYEFTKEHIIKDVISNSETISSGGESLWTAPHAVIKHRLWQRDGKVYAVEVTKSIERKVLGKWERKLANSYVYFVGAANGKARP
jgi:hypothetical protein